MERRTYLVVFFLITVLHQISGQCNNGLFGTNCDQTCGQLFTHCIVCSEESAGVFTCIQCQENYYSRGSYCDVCSQGCMSVGSNATCSPTNGDCRTGCRTGFVGEKCNRCDTNYYYTGGQCFKCSDQCVNSCDGFSGSCNGGCRPGYFGPRCDNTCSITCRGQLCNATTGECSAQGCIDGWYGNECQNPCGRCACDRNNGQCTGTTCNVGYYGTQCDMECSKFCSLNSCDKSSGNCTYDCPNGYYGPFCSRNCSATCSGRECDRTDGRCSGSCVNGYYGDMCTSVCGLNCATRTCAKTDGTCNGDCTQGYYGEYCNKRCSSACEGPCEKLTGYCSGAEASTEEETTDKLPLIIGVSCGGGVVLLIIIIGVACCQRRQARHLNKKAMIMDPGYGGWTFDDERMIDPEPMQFEKMSALNYSVNGSVHRNYHGDTRQSEINYAFDDRDGNTSHRIVGSDKAYEDVGEASEAVTVDEFPRYIARLSATERSFERQHSSLPTGLTDKHEEALKQENTVKNRYKNIYPYDHTRVVLETEEEENTTQGDYINASRLEGYDSTKSYIAAQGPIEQTVNDFWRMVWQEACSNLVMLTNVVEGGVLKCKKYWPDESHEETYGDIRVKNNYREEYADFTITNITLMKEGGKLEVRHLHFTSWPDKDIPQYVTPLVEFNQKVRTYINDTPLLVHCSAGIGRSGTFIALDKLLDQAEAENHVTVHHCVASMRKERVNMIQTHEQYRFLHEALLEALLWKDTKISKENFEDYLTSMLDYIPGSTERKLDAQFKKIKSSSDHTRTEVANLPENTHKNRNKDILACDNCRVFLWSSITGCNDYINAIHIPNYRSKFAYIVTEMPQTRTLIDFCRLIHQEECRTIIMMDTDDESLGSGRYWTETSQTVGCGPFQLVTSATETKPNFVCRSIDFKYNVGDVEEITLKSEDDKGDVSIRQYQCTCWPRDSPAPSSPDAILDVISAVMEWQDLSGNHPILVHCMDGAYRSGLMCLALACCDRIKSDGDVCVPYTLNHLRARRSQLVPYFPQYKFVHEVLQAFIEKQT